MENEENRLKKIVAALKSDESLLNCVSEMIDTVEDKEECLKSGDDAEEAVVSVIQKAGEMLLQKWAEKENSKAEYLGHSDPSMRPHEKKRSIGIHL